MSFASNGPNPCFTHGVKTSAAMNKIPVNTPQIHNAVENTRCGECFCLLIPYGMYSENAPKTGE
ncbi:MAG: hypothetical protein ACXVP2_01905 [Tumebacillaceae bacterium]